MSLLLGCPVTPAEAAGTPVTFSVAAGSISISEPASANLGTAAAGAGSVSGPLGVTTVTDTRGNVVGGWTVTVTSTDFTTGDGTTGKLIPKANVAYDAGTPSAKSPAGGTWTSTPGTLSGSLPAAAFNLFTGNSSATWNPTITVTIPTQIVSGTYAGTITQSAS